VFGLSSIVGRPGGYNTDSWGCGGLLRQLAPVALIGVLLVSHVPYVRSSASIRDNRFLGRDLIAGLVH